MKREKSDADARIVDDDVLDGPRLAGHRISVYDVWTLLDAGETVNDIVEEAYPHLCREQVQAAADYARAHEDEMRDLDAERDAWSEE